MTLQERLKRYMTLLGRMFFGGNNIVWGGRRPLNTRLTWNTTYVRADPKIISLVEERAEVHFPNDYVEVVTKYHGGYPIPNRLWISKDKFVLFDCFLTFSAFDELDILDWFNSLRKKLIPGLFPFALDSNGNVFCFDYRLSKDNPTIVYFDLNTSSQQEKVNVTKVSSTFTEMLHKFF
jgi:hypothetical protein